MERMIPKYFDISQYEFTLVARGGNKTLFLRAFASGLELCGGNHAPKEGEGTYYAHERRNDPSYSTPLFFIARDEPRRLELDIYDEDTKRDTIAFSHTIGLLTTPLLRAGYTVSVANRFEEISKAAKSKGKGDRGFLF